MNSGNRFSIQVLLALLLVCTGGSLWASTEAGKILYSRGVVSIVDEQDSSRGGKTGAVVYEGDRVVTGRGALAQVRLSDGALIALRGSSDYKIEKQSYGEEEDLYEQAGKLFTGWMRSITGAIGQKYPQKVSQSTAVATIGIRGTIYQVIHIPPEGLPGFAGEEPGTYVMLEEGSVEVTGEGGTRLLQPGDVVFMPAAGGAPRLVPKKAGLFRNAEEGVIRFLDSEDPDFSRELNDTLTDVLRPSRPLENFSYMGFAENAGRFDNNESFATLSDVQISGSGSSLVVTGFTYDNDGILTYAANAGAAATDTGNAVLSDGSSVHWGSWLGGDYTVDFGSGPQSTSLPWQYIIGANYIDLAGVTGLMGSVKYDYVGGSHLVDASGAIVASVLNSSYILFDFANVGFEITDLNIETDNLGTFGCVSICSLQDLLQAGLNVQNDLNSHGGSIGGAFVGHGSGLLTTFDLYDLSLGDTVRGTALFGTNTPPVFGIGFLGTTQEGSFSNGGSYANYGASGIAVDGVGAGQYVSGMAVNVEGDYLFAGLSAAPGVQGYYQLDNGAEIFWGVWDVNNYTIDQGSTPQVATAEPWQYMVGTHAFDISTYSGPTGTATFSYVGGTGLIPNAPGSAVAIGATSTLTLDLASLDMAVSIEAGALGTFINQTTATAIDFQTSGIGIGDTGTNTFGTIGGHFIGGGDGAISFINVTDGVGVTYEGTAAFASDTSLSGGSVDVGM